MRCCHCSTRGSSSSRQELHPKHSPKAYTPDNGCSSCHRYPFTPSPGIAAAFPALMCPQTPTAPSTRWRSKTLPTYCKSLTTPSSPQPVRHCHGSCPPGPNTPCNPDSTHHPTCRGQRPCQPSACVVCKTRLATLHVCAHGAPSLCAFIDAKLLEFILELLGCRQHKQKGVAGSSTAV